MTRYICCGGGALSRSIVGSMTLGKVYSWPANAGIMRRPTAKVRAGPPETYSQHWWEKAAHLWR